MIDLFPNWDFEPFLDMNRKANNVKHDNERVELFNAPFLKEFFADFNRFVDYYGMNVSTYCLDESLFDEPITAIREDRTEEVVEPRKTHIEISDGEIYIPCHVGNNETGIKLYYFL